MRSKTGRYITLIAGLLVAISAVLSQTIAFSSQSGKESVVVTPEAGNTADESQDTENFAFLSPSSLPTPTFVTFNHEAICLFEILFPEDAALPAFEQVDRPLIEFFSVLIGAVISPNAP